MHLSVQGNVDMARYLTKQLIFRLKYLNWVIQDTSQRPNVLACISSSKTTQPTDQHSDYAYGLDSQKQQASSFTKNDYGG